MLQGRVPHWPFNPLVLCLYNERQDLFSLKIKLFYVNVELNCELLLFALSAPMG